MPTQEELRRFAPDLYAQRYYRVLQYIHGPLHLALAGALFAVGGWSWVIWGVFVRLVVSYHATWLVNSAAHSLGYRTFRTPDLSTNCWWVALISWGKDGTIITTRSRIRRAMGCAGLRLIPPGGASRSWLCCASPIE